jgi:hypothetical protein
MFIPKTRHAISCAVIFYNAGVELPLGVYFTNQYQPEILKGAILNYNISPKCIS